MDTSICDFEECYEYRVYEYESGTEYREARAHTVPCYILPPPKGDGVDNQSKKVG